jgi:methane monooxygenase component A alpha chain
LVHDKAKSLGWEPRAGSPYAPTRYKIPKTTKDPFRHLLSEYYEMERGKDNRAYGMLEESQQLVEGPSRWLEVLKPLLGFTINGEFTAMKSMAMLIDAVPNTELRQGYLAQMMDELRHTNLEAQLLRRFVKTAPDPAGFNDTARFRASDPILRAGRAAFESFLTDDPIACSIGLQVVTETAYTNPLFVAATEIAAANGDNITPPIFLSIQSDEARHMANGYATLAAVMSEPDNMAFLQEDLDRCFWRQHVFMDRFLPLLYDYFSSVRLRCYKELWEEWVWQDWVGGYIDRLAPHGITRPPTVDYARENVKWAGHDIAAVSAAMWPLQFWRRDPLTDADFSYLENKYPGWWSRHGAFWTAYATASDRSQGDLALRLIGNIPLICRVCQMPARPIEGTVLQPVVGRDGSGRRHAFCSSVCRDIFVDEPHRYQGQTWTEINDGLELSEYVLREGLVRADGVTLVAQPHLSTEDRDLWTVDDLRRHEIEIVDPLRTFPVDQIQEL